MSGFYAPDFQPSAFQGSGYESDPLAYFDSVSAAAGSATGARAIAELSWVVRLEQACLLREAALLRSALLRGHGEWSDALASARWFGAWQPSGTSSLSVWLERTRDLIRASEADGMPTATILRQCAEQDLADWPAASRLAREAQELDPCHYGRLIIARARFADGRVSAARRGLESLCAGRNHSRAGIPRAVRSGALATLSALEDIEGGALSAFRPAREAFVFNPSLRSALWLFELSLRLGRRQSARRAAAVLCAFKKGEWRESLDAPLRAVRAYARLRALRTRDRQFGGSQGMRSSIWLEFMESADRRLFELCLQLAHAAE